MLRNDLNQSGHPPRLTSLCALINRESLATYWVQLGELPLNGFMYAWIQKVFFRGGPTLTLFLRGKRGSEYNKRTFIDPPAKRHLNYVSLADRWWPNIECCLGSSVIFHGIQTSIDKEPYSFVIFEKGVRTPCPPPL